MIKSKISDAELSKVSGGRKIEKYNFYDIESKKQKAYIEIEDGEMKSSWGLDSLNDRDKAQLPDDLRRKLGL